MDSWLLVFLQLQFALLLGMVVLVDSVQRSCVHLLLAYMIREGKVRGNGEIFPVT